MRPMRGRDAQQCCELEYGAAIAALLMRGFSVRRIAFALDMDVRTARKLAGRYLAADALQAHAGDAPEPSEAHELSEG